MFSRRHRLTTTKAILQVLRRGDRQVVGCVSCSFLKKPGTLGKVTVIVDSKVAKKAVDRNRLKRQARAILRERGLPEGELTVRFLKGAPDRSYPEINAHLSECLRRVTTTRSKR